MILYTSQPNNFVLNKDNATQALNLYYIQQNNSSYILTFPHKKTNFLSLYPPIN